MIFLFNIVKFTLRTVACAGVVSFPRTYINVFRFLTIVCAGWERLGKPETHCFAAWEDELTG